MATLATTTAGTIISISASLPASYNSTGFSALTYTSIGEVTDIGDIGKTYNSVTHNNLADRKTYKLKGNYNNGTMSLSLASAPSDAGQAIALTALDDDDDYSFKITDQDGSVHYFTGKVMSYVVSRAGEAVKSASVSIEVEVIS